MTHPHPAPPISPGPPSAAASAPGPTTAPVVMPGALPLTHLLAALFVVAIWGTNFVVIHVGLAAFPPFTFAALRFAMASLPLLPFVRWPKASLRTVASYGLLIGFGQFGLLFYAMNGQISPGLASILVQTQSFFSVGLAVLLNGDRLTRRDLGGLALCGGGIALIAANVGGDITPYGLVLILGAALCWAGGNIVARRAGPVNAFALVAWSNLFAVGPLALTAWLMEGPQVMAAAVQHASPAAWGTVVWQTAANSILGYGVWTWLLGRHPASRVAPLGLMVPVFGLAAAALWLGEAMPAWKLLGAAAIVSGLGFSLIAKKPQVPRQAQGKPA